MPAEEVVAVRRLTVGVCRETADGEHRVALVPGSVGPIAALGAHVAVHAGAGAEAGFTDDSYAVAGAAVLSRAQVIARADVLVGVLTPGRGAFDRPRRGQVLLGLLRPHRHPLTMRYLADHGITAVSADLIPGTPFRDGDVDAAASQAAVAGHEAVLLAAARCDRLPGGGTGGPPIRVLVIGTGTAGRQAMATARELGAAAQGYDPGLPGRLALTELVPRFDIVVATGPEPAEAAPDVLVTTEAVAAMRPGSVVVDTTVEPGGCTVEPARAGTVAAVPPGVTVMGAGDLPSRFANTSSVAYSRRITALLSRFVRAGSLAFDLSDPLQDAVVVTHDRGIRDEAVRRQILGMTAVAGLP
jgi:NAD(P) transhydrogenase subunit alpha